MTDKVVTLADFRPVKSLSGPAVCLGCRHEWPGEAPIGVTAFQCPKCGTKRGVFKLLVGVTSGFWRCDCGNDAFELRRDGAHCLVCGVKSTWSPESV